MTNVQSGPSASVVINTYNGAKYLKAAIDSIYAQTFQDFEIIVYDNASMDETEKIARSFDGRLRYIRSEKFLTLGKARNEAIQASRGRFIAFLDSDDLFLPRKLERQVARFQDGISLVFCNSIRFWEGTGREALLYRSPPKEGQAFRDLLRGYYLSMNTVMIRRDALPASREWWFPETMDLCEELDLFLRLAYLYPIAYVNEPLAKYRIHGENWSIRRPELFVTEQREILDRLEKFIPDFQAHYKEEAADYRSQTERIQAQIFWGKGDKHAALAHYMTSIRLNFNPVLIAEMALSAVFPYGVLSALRQWIGRPL